MVIVYKMFFKRTRYLNVKLSGIVKIASML